MRRYLVLLFLGASLLSPSAMVIAAEPERADTEARVRAYVDELELLDKDRKLRLIQFQKVLMNDMKLQAFVMDRMAASDVQAFRAATIPLATRVVTREPEKGGKKGMRRLRTARKT